MHAIGSSYLIRQTAGSEKLGGLMVTLKRRVGTAGKIEVVPTCRWTKELLTEIDHLIDQALAGIKDAAQQHNVSLDDFDILLTEFAYHSVDSYAPCYYQAAKSALRAALESWYGRDL